MNSHGLVELTDRLATQSGDKTGVVVSFERNGERMASLVKLGIRSVEDSGTEVRKAWLPVSLQGLSIDIAKKWGLPTKSALLVTRVHKNRSAERSGLKTGDIIIRFDGQGIPMAVPGDVESFLSLVRQYRIGSEVALTVWRDKQEVALSTELEEFPKSPREMKHYSDEVFDFSARDVAFADRVRESWDASLQGAFVENVGEGGWASLAHLAVGDLIIAVDGTPIANTAALEERLKSTGKTRPETVLLQVRRGIHSLFIEIQPVWNKTS
jgi:serine protease Do